MKTPLLTRWAALAMIGTCLIFFSACSKKDKKPTANNSNDIIATITLEDGSKVEYVGYVAGVAIWSREEGTNMLSVIATDKAYKNATLAFGISYADTPGSYSLDTTELMANPAKLFWDGMEYHNGKSYVTGDADGDGDSDGTGTFKITTLSEKQTNGTFSMVMGNNPGEILTVEGKFN